AGARRARAADESPTRSAGAAPGYRRRAVRRPGSGQRGGRRMRRGAWASTLATGMVLALGIGFGPVLADNDFGSVESDETRGPVTITGVPDEPAAPLTMPSAVPPVATGSGLVAYEPEGQYTRR